MKWLLDRVDRLVAQEYLQAASKFGPKNNSPHESYAVILEEYDEAESSASIFRTCLSAYWRLVKNDEPANSVLTGMRQAALNAAAEWIQVAAMCTKALQGTTREDSESPEQEDLVA